MSISNPIAHQITRSQVGIVAAVAGIVLVGLVVVVLARPGGTASTSQPSLVRSDPASVSALLYSDYLRSIAGTWGLQVRASARPIPRPTEA